MIVREFDNFVATFDFAMSDELCDYAINHFDYAKDMGLVYSRQHVEGIPSVAKKDETYFPVDEENEEMQISNSRIFSELKNVLTTATNMYVQEYSSLSNMEYKYNTFRLQKTGIGGGYHMWHHERGDQENSTRFLAAILYLNDVEEGGETEFLYQHKRVKPRKGTLVMWPAGFTHTHRGNPPISNEKYIITTWAHLT